MQVNTHRTSPRLRKRRQRRRRRRTVSISLFLLLTGALIFIGDMRVPLAAALRRDWSGVFSAVAGRLPPRATAATAPPPGTTVTPPTSTNVTPPAPTTAKPAPGTGATAAAGPAAGAIRVPTAADFDRLASDLPILLEPYGARSAIWFKDLSSGRQIIIGADQQFHPASTVKLPLVVALIEGARAGHWSLDDSWAITAADWEDGAGDLQDVPAGTSFTLRDLAKRAIEESDNIAANALFRRVGYQTVRESMRQAGATIRSGTLDGLTVADMGPVLVRLAQRAAADPTTWQPLMDWLAHTSFNDWLPAALPKGFTAYHKWGGLDGYDHDVAIVQGGSARYVLVIYTENTRDNAGLIRAVSARVAGTYIR